MKLTSRQAAELLGCAPSTVVNLTKRGELTDYAPKVRTGKRHQVRVDQDEVLAYARKQPKGTAPSNGSEPHTVGTVRPTPENDPVGRFATSTPPEHQGPRPVSKIEERLRRIEDKLDQLMQLWG